MLISQQLKKRERLGSVTTVREFTGGWNTVDNEYNMPPRYARVLRNVVRNNDGTLGPRYGTKLHADIAIFGVGNIINLDYFGTHLIVVTDQGNIIAVDGQGTASLIWSNEIAAMQLGAPRGWTNPTTFASFSQFKSKLVIANGLDKPVVVNSNLNVSYLVDAATGSNVNVPVARYSAAAVGDRYGYFVFGEGTLLHIGSANTLGTFFGDPPPNDGTQFDLASKVTAGDPTLRGMRFYRDRLLCGFDEVIVVLQLGNYVSTDHVPLVSDVIEGFGCISHRTMFPLNEDIYMVDNIGVPYISRAKLSTALIGDRASDLIYPEIQEALQNLSTETVEDRVFAIQNHNDEQWMLFIPNGDEVENTTESKGFVYTADKEGAWSEFRNWNWVAGCHSLQNNIFFAGDTRIWLYGNGAEPISADYVDDQETWTDGTAWSDFTGFTPLAEDGSASGIPIQWAWEPPWADFGKRMTMKKSLFFGADAEGTAAFDVKMYTDGVYEDLSDPGEFWTDNTSWTDETGWVRQDVPLLPALMHQFIGSTTGGFGIVPFGVMMGGGHASNSPKLFRWPARFKLAKFRFEGYTMEPLRMASFSLVYNTGGLRR